MPNQGKSTRPVTMTAAEHLTRAEVLLFEAEWLRDNDTDYRKTSVVIQLANAHAGAATAVEAVYPSTRV